ncbi:sensor histidine kinase [Nannocystis pusilla]|uniref:sensor histidine kinase n=1 Tax=Nannocystis pusilla TaxID=889268 RepID=UPI003DA3D3E4
MLTAAVGNLIQNALKFTHDAGVVFLHGRAVDEAILIEVEDRCGGLSPAAKEHMFDPPARRARDPRSRGFGLTIARKAVEGTGGSLRVGDLPGVGCVFTVTLPRTQRNLRD